MNMNKISSKFSSAGRKISAVYCVHNGEEFLEKSFKSVKDFATEIVVVDLESTDKTVEIAQKYGAKVFKHKNIGYVEPVRNFGISKTTGDWILVIDPDEELTEKLKEYLKKEINKSKAQFYRIPRKNIIFGEWIKHTGWWPDMNIRFFKRGHVSWNEVIHTVPMTTGKGLDLPVKEELAIEHDNYPTMDSYFEKMIRYSKVQSAELIDKKYVFSWQDLIKKPLNEFLSRFFARQGYKDGLHGLVLSLLQSVSEFLIVLRIWEYQKYQKQELTKKDISLVFNMLIKDLKWWIRKEFSWLKFL